jgi:PAS domain S-box-containing protein
MDATSIPEVTHEPVQGGPEEACDMLVGIDPMGCVTFLRYMNPQAAATFGYAEKDILGEHVTDFILGADSITAAEHFGRLYASENAFRAPSRQLKTKSGVIIAAENYIVPSYDNVGKFTGHYGMVFFKK